MNTVIIVQNARVRVHACVCVVLAWACLSECDACDIYAEKRSLRIACVRVYGSMCLNDRRACVCIFIA